MNNGGNMGDGWNVGGRQSVNSMSGISSNNMNSTNSMRGGASMSFPSAEQGGGVKKSGNKGVVVLVTILVALVVGVGGFCLGKFVFKDTPTKTECANNENNSGTVESAVENKPQEARTKNPIIVAEQPKFFSQRLESGVISGVAGYDGGARVIVTIKNGEVSECNTQDVGAARIVGTCEIAGLSGKIYKAVEVGEGQSSMDDSLAFIMEDGSVEYLPLQAAIANSDYSIKGKMKIDGFVTDAFMVNTGDANAMVGGYGTTIFVLANGQFVQYDKAML